jgi:Uncharacterised conserved protein
MLRLWGLVSGAPALDSGLKSDNDANPTNIDPPGPDCVALAKLSACFRVLEAFAESGLPGVAAADGKEREALAEAEREAWIARREAESSLAMEAAAAEAVVDDAEYVDSSDDVDADGGCAENIIGDTSGDASGETSDDAGEVDENERLISEVVATDAVSKVIPNAGSTLAAVQRNVADSPKSDAQIQLPEDIVVEALHAIAHIMVVADKDGLAAWDRFMECNAMRLLVRCLHRTAPPPVEPVSDVRSAGTIVPTSPARTFRVSPSIVPPVAPAKDLLAISRAEGAQKLHQSMVRPISSDFSVDREIAVKIQSQALRTLSILIQSVSRRESLYCMFSANHINDLLAFEYEFSNEELILYYMSAVKSIGSKLDDDLVQFFLDTHTNTFPLYTASTRFFDHPESMVRISIRNLTLSIYSLTSPAVLEFVCLDPTDYLTRSVNRLRQMCGEASRALEFLLDDGRELRRTVSRRVGQFRGQQVRMPHLIAELAEIDNIIEYLNEVAGVQDDGLSKLVVRLMVSKLIGPFFRPISSQASPAAVALQRKGWHFRSKPNPQSVVDDKACVSLNVLDAASRTIVLAYIINLVTDDRLADALLDELTRPSIRFERRSIVNGIKAMASELSGTERTTHIAFCALEALVRADFVSSEKLTELGLSFELDDDSDAYMPEKGETVSGGNSFILEPTSARSSKSGTSDAADSLIMNLNDFHVPLNPMNSYSTTRNILRNDIGGPERLTLPPSPATLSIPCKVDELDDQEGILILFRKGEASLREMLSAALLVIRAREVRSVRVTQSIVRIISAIGLRTGNWRVSLDVTKIALDEMATAISDFLVSDKTTIVAIESTFENFFLASQGDSLARRPVPDLWALLHLDSLPKLASDLPGGAGRQRRSASVGNAVVPPIEREDADTFFVLLHCYERILVEVVCSHRALTGAVAIPLQPLHESVAAILQEEDYASTYLDKREALARIAHLTQSASLGSRLVP